MADFRHRITIHGEDRASGALRAVGESSQGMGRKIADATATISHAINIAKAFAAAAQAMANAMAKPIKLAGEQEQAVVRLNAAMRTSGQYTAAASKALQENAAALQKVTRYGDEAIMPVQALLLQFGGLATDQVPRATKAVIDFAEANGTDLKGAAQLVAKAIGTSTNALSRYGIEIDNSLRGAERFEAILGQIEEKVGGTAQAMGGTFLGKLQMVSNAWGDLLEKIGDFVIKNEAVRAGVDALVGMLESWSARLKEGSEGTEALNEAVTVFVQEKLPVLIDGLAWAVEATAALTVATVELIGKFGGLGNLIKTTMGPLFGELAERLWENAEGSAETAAEMDKIRRAGASAAEGIRAFASALREATTISGHLRRANAEILDIFNELPAGVRKAFAADPYRQAVNNATRVRMAFDQMDEAMRKKLQPDLETLERLLESVFDSDEAARAVFTLAETMRQAMNETVSSPVGLPPADGLATWEEYWDAVNGASAQAGDRISQSITDSITNALVDRSTTWKEQFEDFGTTLKTTMIESFLDPIFGAESAFSDVFASMMSPLRKMGEAINAVIQQMVTGIVNFFSKKDVLQTQDAQKQIATNAATSTAVTAQNTAAAATSTAAWTPAAIASSIATLGLALAFGVLVTKLLQKWAPKFAEGGVVSTPTYAMVGEAGEEYIINPRRNTAPGLLQDLFTSYPSLAPSGRGGAAAVAAVSNTNTFQITVHAGGSNEDVADVIVDRIDRLLGERM